MILRRSLPDLLARAYVEIDRNPTITTYVWQDGREIRSRIEPWLSFRRSLGKIGRAYIHIKPDTTKFRDSIEQAFGPFAMPAARHQPVGLFPRQLSIAPPSDPEDFQ